MRLTNERVDFSRLLHSWWRKIISPYICRVIVNFQGLFFSNTKPPPGRRAYLGLQTVWMWVIQLWTEALGSHHYSMKEAPPNLAASTVQKRFWSFFKEIGLPVRVPNLVFCPGGFLKSHSLMLTFFLFKPRRICWMRTRFS